MVNVSAPSAYEPEKHVQHTPAFTFGTRNEIKVSSDAPGNKTALNALDNPLTSTVSHLVGISPRLAPGHYHPEQCKLDSSPAYSFGLKTLPIPSLPGMYFYFLYMIFYMLR